MILTIDIGNTNIAFGIWADGQWLDHWRLKTDAEKTSDEYLVLFRSLLAVSSHDFNGWDRIVVSSVVPTLTPAILTALSSTRPARAAAAKAAARCFSFPEMKTAKR